MMIPQNKPATLNTTGPILGYNFSRNVSTSSPEVTGYSNGGTITTLPTALDGYTKTLRSQSNEILLTPSSAVNNIGTTDFTVEFWIDMVSLPTNYQTLFSIQYSNGFYLHIEFGDGGYGNRLYVGFDFRQNSTVFVTPFTSTATGNKNRWVHFAYVRQNRVAKIFIDGQQQQLAAGPFAQYDRTSFNGDYDLSGAITKMRLFGSFQGASHDIYMSEFALFNYAKYTANFTKPTGGPIYPNEKVLQADKPYVDYNVDSGFSQGSTTVSLSNQSGNIVAPPTSLDGYTKAFNMSSVIPNITPVTAFDVGASDFTFEFPFYLTASASGYNTLFYQKGGNGSGIYISIGDSAYGNRLRFSLGSDTGQIYCVRYTRAQLLNTWHHIAMVRQGNVCYIYIDGIKQTLAVGTDTTYNTQAIPITNSLGAGSTVLSFGNSTGSLTPGGYIPEFALHKVIKYTKNFLPYFPFYTPTYLIDFNFLNAATGSQTITNNGSLSLPLTRSTTSSSPTDGVVNHSTFGKCYYADGAAVFTNDPKDIGLANRDYQIYIEFSPSTAAGAVFSTGAYPDPAVAPIRAGSALSLGQFSSQYIQYFQTTSGGTFLRVLSDGAYISGVMEQVLITRIGTNITIENLRTGSKNTYNEINTGTDSYFILFRSHDSSASFATFKGYLRKLTVRYL